jgi:hypothetical protein
MKLKSVGKLIKARFIVCSNDTNGGKSCLVLIISHADFQEQEEFKQQFPNLVDEALKTREPQDNRPVLLMAQDEGRFGRLGQVMKAWCPTGHRPLVAKQGVRDYVYAYAAIAPALGKMTTLVLHGL